MRISKFTPHIRHCRIHKAESLRGILVVTKFIFHKSLRCTHPSPPVCHNCLVYVPFQPPIILHDNGRVCHAMCYALRAREHDRRNLSDKLQRATEAREEGGGGGKTAALLLTPTTSPPFPAAKTSSCPPTWMFLQRNLCDCVSSFGSTLPTSLSNSPTQSPQPSSSPCLKEHE
ncbi:hypothetical protein BaRGS_00028485 [Batillaria attramentaria]|uniref:Uncharacterized protein n=1 Tax=Batillaria attramentaria TaxID=370345 RepID=A0ABD0K045_9CAEN